MSSEETVSRLLSEVSSARRAVENGDTSFGRKLAELERRTDNITRTADQMIAKLHRAGGMQVGGAGEDFEAERKQALGLLELKQQFRSTKRDPAAEPLRPTEEQITEAATACKAIKAVMHSTDVTQLTPEQRKSLTSFNMGASGFILPPEMSNQILSCLVYPTDVSGLMGNMAVAGPSIKFLVDNAMLETAAWACESSCFANNPQQHLTDGLGELEIKPETLRYVICASRDLLEDAATNLEAWLVGKVQRAFGMTISNAIINGDGVGKPLGILNPHAGIIICDTATTTPAGMFTWQDLIMLKWQVPQQFHAGGSYLMNQYTFAQALTLSDAMGRPILLANPTDPEKYLLNGSPVQIVTQMPSVAPGAVPVAFGSWSDAYMVVNRKAVTMLQDPYSAGFCILFKFEARVGGAVVCANAARLLRTR